MDPTQGLPSYSADGLEAPPTYDSTLESWPPHLYFRRSTDATVLDLFPTPSDSSSPIFRIDAFTLSWSQFNLYLNYHFKHVYPGTSPGSRIWDLRSPSTTAAFTTRHVLPPLGSREDHPAMQRFVFKGRYQNSNEEVVLHIHESARFTPPGAFQMEGYHVKKVQARFDLDGVSARWIMCEERDANKWWNFAGVGGSSSSGGTGAGSGEENVGRHEFQVLMKGEWVTVAYAEVDHKPFYKYTLAESAPGKGGSHDPRPVFGKIEFVMDKLCWLNCEQRQVLAILSSLLQVWLGDVLNKEGRLEHVLAERMKKYRNLYNQMGGTGYVHI
ncbi:hypothetical protein BCR33DRAFT_713976 [Rhizoclosmatium globosum]|uniref:Uncharacterized protein n=1 Tax=Rhizoclosmatium globosum TaxID=329046 RepID=A0A1Y2CP89_9FUNG|nr:hypothetical protein BCR33DRAFT_713976 [Rhizoclosmatium globosum]|eukprot:ORY48859.1 hypothetical protein BCR33DRAFT_713976 [Rhizoclosmatium globosum]